jgi:hypothetical protein
MAMNIYQRKAIVKFGLTASTTDVSTDVHACTVKVSYDMIDRRGTFGNPLNTQVAGNGNVEIILDFDSDGAYSGSTIGALVNSVAFQAINSATPYSPVLYYDIVFDDAVVGASNKRVTGTCTVPEGQRGGEVNTLRQLQVSFPVLTYVEANS